MASTTLTARPTPTSQSYASAVKQLKFSKVSRCEKIEICRRLLSSHYHPDPSTTVLNFLCALIAKEAPSVEDIYTIRNSNSIPEHAVHDWTILTHALRRYTFRFRDHSGHREPPLVPNGVLIQGGLHLLQGSCALQTAVAEAFYLILKHAQYSRDLETHTWFFCAVAQAEGVSSVMDPLRTAVLSQFLLIMSHEHDKNNVAAAAASIASRAVPSELASDLEKVVVHSIRASPCTFHDTFAKWVLQSEESLPQAIQFLLRAYIKHPLKTSGERSSSKRSLWEAARLDALAFFEALTDHMLQAIRAGGNQRFWSEQEFHARMKAIQVLYLIGSEHAVYMPLQDQSQYEGSNRKKSRNGENSQGKPATGIHGLLLELIGVASSLRFEAEINSERIKVTFQAICAIAKLSSDVIDELLPDVLALCVANKDSLQDRAGDVSNNCELFCTLVLRYERSRELNKLLTQLMKTSSLHSITTVLRQKPVQEVLGATFSRLRRAEAEACVQSLIPTSFLSAKEVPALTLMSSLVLETIASPFLPRTAIAITNQIIESLLQNPINSEIRQCRMHLLSSFFIAKTSNTILSTERDVRVAMLRLAISNDRKEGTREGVPLEHILLETLATGQSSVNAAELCANLRCLTALAHYSFQYGGDSDNPKFIARVLQIMFARFGILDDLLRKTKVSTNDNALSSILYGSISYGLVLSWLGSLGHLLTRYGCVEKGEGEIIVFFSRALQFLPVTHPFWNEICEERKWGPAVMKASCSVLEGQLRSLKCEKDMRSCLLSRVLASISMMPSCFFAGPDYGKLLNLVFHCIWAPCCSSSRQEGLNATKKFDNTLDFRECFMTFLQQEEEESVQSRTNPLEGNSTMRQRDTFPAKRTIVAIQVITSQTPKGQVPLLSQDVAVSLRTAILGLRMAFETDLEPSIPSAGALYDFVGALLDLRANLKSGKDIDARNDGISKLEDAATECIKVALPLCVKSLSKESTGKMSHCQAAQYMLSAMARLPSPIHRQIISGEERDSLHDVLTQVYIPYLLHSPCVDEELVDSIFRNLSILVGSSMQGICQVLLALLDRALGNIRCRLPSVLRNDESQAMEAASRLVLMATRLTASCARLCNTSRYSLIESSQIVRKGVTANPQSSAHANWHYNTCTRILSGLECFLRTWNCVIQELSVGRITELRTSTLLRNSSSLASSSMKACLEMTASRSWSRRDMEHIVLLTRQVVERVCLCRAFLRNEREILLNSLRICRMAARRHSGLIPAASQMITVLLRRGIDTDNMVIIGAVREAVEELCNISKTWEILSALLADCSSALDATMGSESRREAEKSAAVLLKAVGERRAQQVLSCLNDSGRESLKQVWEMYSDKLHYSGK